MEACGMNIRVAIVEDDGEMRADLSSYIERYARERLFIPSMTTVLLQRRALISVPSKQSALRKVKKFLLCSSR